MTPYEQFKAECDNEIAQQNEITGIINCFSGKPVSVKQVYGKLF